MHVLRPAPRWLALLCVPMAACLATVDDLKQPVTVDAGDASVQDDGPNDVLSEEVSTSDAPPDADGGPPQDVIEAPQSYAEVVLADNPAAYWRLDDGAGSTELQEETGSGIVATTVGAPEFGLAGALRNGPNLAMGLSATAELTMGDVFDFPDRAPFSVEGWFNPNVTDTEYRHLVTKEDYDTTDIGYTVSFNQTFLTFERQPESPADGPETSVFRPHVWQHVVATYDGIEMCLYVNTARTCTSSTTSLADHDRPFAVGKGYEGLVDEIAVYETVLDATQVDEHYRAAGVP